jgi:hypothetical protein
MLHPSGTRAMACGIDFTVSVLPGTAQSTSLSSVSCADSCSALLNLLLRALHRDLKALLIHVTNFCTIWSCSFPVSATGSRASFIHVTIFCTIWSSSLCCQSHSLPLTQGLPSLMSLTSASSSPVPFAASRIIRY